MLANTAGTLLAAVVVYVYAVVVGLVRANWRILAPILLGVALVCAYAGQEMLHIRILKRAQETTEVRGSW
jgi:hypothetical protein